MKVAYSGEQLAQIYRDIRLKHEESTMFVDCGFKQATSHQDEILAALKLKTLSLQQLHSVKPFFLLENIQIEDHVKIKKRFFFGF
ncbi:hypothetical protein [Pseudoalteromonas obscura]|uniref:Uncharacterized protein n=1 Tax=Pseudoalteromonas obscura TaxID=3048491 RepID=A0ABT7EN22_9GAMM|nr:hypothetical protein [Pseudoalteromonas sp. P94(2023)]MDK2596452.1 hypothetical protein [Pseudoalteromonas sp. P94(2023)]